jgi:hypothetical protein
VNDGGYEVGTGAPLRAVHRLPWIIVEDAHAVTVEVLARWLHERLREPVRAAGGEWLLVRVWESGEAYGAYRGAA